MGVFPCKGALGESSGHSSGSSRNLTREGLGQLQRGLWPWTRKREKQRRKEETKVFEEGRGALTQVESRNCPQQEKGQEQAAFHVPAVL